MRIFNIKNKIEIKEHFIGFKTVHNSSGTSLKDLFLRTLQENHIPFRDCRGQSYENGANMKGHKKGV